MSAPETPASRDEFADARAELFNLINGRIEIEGLNPPLGLQDHHTADRFHALVFVERAEDVMAWALSLEERIPIGRPEVWEYAQGLGTRRITEARVILADNRSVIVRHSALVEGVPEPAGGAE